MRARQTAAEVACLAVLLAWLAWVPLPFGSASDDAQTAFILPPLVLCALAALIAGRDLHPGRSARLWLLGGVLFLAAMALQLLPMPMPLLRALSPESARLWRAADRIAALAGVPATAFHPISIDPHDTVVQWFRTAAYIAAFAASMLLTRTSRRRMALALTLGVMAIFEAIYAVREAALQRYAVWGWKNTLIFNRATGTFVNPNHFAHYAAIILPMAVFICAFAWHTAAPPGAPRGRRVVALVERRFLLFSFGVAAALACIVAILVAQSRGAALSTAAGFALAGAMASGRRHAVARAGLIGVTVLAVFGGVLFLLAQSPASGTQHLEERDAGSLQGRRSSVTAALRMWLRFPLFGSGAGTYESLAPGYQDESDELIANHAHNDYAEVLATTGAVGFLVSFVPLLGGFAALARTAFGARAQSSWRRRAFARAALTSIAIALAHALIDFNVYIPANPATLAAIAGAAVAIRDPEL